jgi:hypothetical protein
MSVRRSLATTYYVFLFRDVVHQPLTERVPERTFVIRKLMLYNGLCG